MSSEATKLLVILMTTLIGTVYVNTCDDGFHGQNCKSKCPRACTTCKYENYCTKCEPGYYNGYINGEYSHICAGECAARCLTCDGNYAKCTRCVDGHYIGRSKDDPENLERKDCVLKCRPNCKTCYSYNNCTKCMNGYFGQRCHNNCPERCANCNIIDGSCIENCKIGLFGQYCNLTCSECRNNNCSSGGHCIEGCKAGFYGSFCNKTCPDNCKKYCEEGDKCNLCGEGYFGDMCNQSCPDHCSCRNCKRDGRCYECKNGYYGPKCLETCPNSCSERICNKTNGVCLETKQDDVGKDKVFTDERNGTKDVRHVNLDGQAGMDNQTVNDYMLEDCKRTEADQFSISYLVVVASSVAGVIVAIAFAVILFMIIKRRWYAKSSQEHTEHSQGTGSQNVTIGMTSEASARDRHLASTHPVSEPYEELNAMTREPNNTADNYSALELF